MTQKIKTKNETEDLGNVDEKGKTSGQ